MTVGYAKVSKLERQWLWSIFGSKIRENVGIDDQYDELEDLPDPPPRQELTQPENIVVVPDPSGDLEGEFEIKVAAQAAAPLKNWREVLESLAYPAQTVEITGQTITDVESQELTDGGWKMRESHAPYAAMSHMVSKVRAPVEGVFGTLKRSYGYWRTRYMGLEKNAAEAMFKVMAYNLRRADRLCAERAALALA